MQWIKSKYLRFYGILTPSKVRVFGVLMIILAAIIAWKSLLIVGIIIGALQLIGMVFLPILRTEYAIFSLITFPIGKVVGFVAMAVIYFLVIAPIGLFKNREFPYGWVESAKDIAPDKMHE